ncbi:MAG TPA: GPR endopeptidase, partial [Verrucomicrobiae bacterium]|nr:GPR endopeptidase [Verrucomicrobiae bacterium]
MSKSNVYKRFNVSLDMVLEAHEVLRGDSGKEIPGVRLTEHKFPHATITNISILDSEGEQQMGKPVGNYITIDAPSVRENNRDVHKQIG